MYQFLLCIILSCSPCYIMASDYSLSDSLEARNTYQDEIAHIYNNLYETQWVLKVMHKRNPTQLSHDLKLAWGAFTLEQQRVLSSYGSQHKIIDLVLQRCNILKHIAALGLALGKPLCFIHYSTHGAIHVSQNGLFAIPGHEMLLAQMQQTPLSEKERALYQRLREANQLQRIGYMLYNLQHIRDWLTYDINNLSIKEKNMTTPTSLQEPQTSETHNNQVKITTDKATTLVKLIEADTALFEIYRNTQHDVQQILEKVNSHLYHSSDNTSDNTNRILSDYLKTGLQLIYKQYNNWNILDIVGTYNSIIHNVQAIGRWKHAGYLPNPPFIQGEYHPYDNCSMNIKGPQSVRDMYGTTPVYESEQHKRRIDVSLIEAKNMLPHHETDTLQPQAVNSCMCTLL